MAGVAKQPLWIIGFQNVSIADLPVPKLHCREGPSEPR